MQTARVRVRNWDCKPPETCLSRKDVDRGPSILAAISICLESWVMLLRIPWLGRSVVHFLLLPVVPHKAVAEVSKIGNL